MRAAIYVVIILVSVPVAWGGEESGATWNWSQWRYLPVQDGGRQKPLDSLARETLQLIAQRQSLRDPATQENLDAVAVYLSMLFDWTGWNAEAGPSRTAQETTPAQYFAAHEPDKWDRLPIFRVDSLSVRHALGLPDEIRRVSAIDLCEATIRDPMTGDRISFLTWVDRIAREDRELPGAVDQDIGRLAARLNLYLAHRMGIGLRVLPVAGDASHRWNSVNHLWSADFDNVTDPTNVLRRMQNSLQRLHAAYHAGSIDGFNRSATELIAAATDSGPQLGAYPRRAIVALELMYNQWKPFRFGAMAGLCSLGLLVIGKWANRRLGQVIGIIVFAAGMLAVLAGLVTRVIISGRAPVTNMYESLIFAGLGIGLLGLAFEFRFAGKSVIVAAAAVTTCMLLVAESCPETLNQSLGLLHPALRDNFWLVVHVLIITASYSAFALAMGIGNVTLGYYVVRSSKWDTIQVLDSVNIGCLRIGTALLVVGTVTGGMWAENSWGRFWGWDPKEVWALITLLGYVAVMHARHVQWVGQFGLAALSVLCFSLVVIAWYGVNFVLGTGLHSYGRGSGGEGYVTLMLLAQFLFVALAAVRSVGHVRSISR
jgi:cytochrome c-type biogenesis protein CcsB